MLLYHKVITHNLRFLFTGISTFAILEIDVALSFPFWTKENLICVVHQIIFHLGKTISVSQLNCVFLKENILNNYI